MGQAQFVADDPTGVTDAQLEQIVPQLRGVLRWDVAPDGTVTIEYDDGDIAVETIEEAIAGLGFRVKPLSDNPDAGAGSAPPRNRGTTFG